MDEKINYYIIIVLTGDFGAGKTSFIKNIAPIHMTPEPDIIEYRRKTFTVKNKIVQTIIWDTFGWEKYNAISEAYYRGAKAALLFYDITNLNSFNSLERWLNDIHKYAEQNAVIILIGNKCDSSDVERQVSIERGQDFAKQHNLLFCEMSNRNYINVEASIMKLLDKVVSTLELEER